MGALQAELASCGCRERGAAALADVFERRFPHLVDVLHERPHHVPHMSVARLEAVVVDGVVGGAASTEARLRAAQ